MSHRITYRMWCQSRRRTLAEVMADMDRAIARAYRIAGVRRVTH